jgi:hypothetical protein
MKRPLTIGDGMIRDEWVFEYSGATLAEATRIKNEHHRLRLAWWNEKKMNVMESIRSDGLEITESVGARSTSAYVAGARAQILVRTDLQSKLDECSEKIRFHAAKTSEYAGWLEVLGANPESALKLDFEDYLFFFGKPPAAPDPAPEETPTHFGNGRSTPRKTKLGRTQGGRA